jgi:hypothetical protein
VPMQCTVCVYVCMCVCVYVYMCVHVCVCVNARAHTNTHTCMYTHTHTIYTHWVAGAGSEEAAHVGHHYVRTYIHTCMYHLCKYDNIFPQLELLMSAMKQSTWVALFDINIIFFIWFIIYTQLEQGRAAMKQST